MFSFYRLKTAQDANTEKPIKIQLEDTPENLLLKDRLLSQINEYELFYIHQYDRYYHTIIDETVFPIDLSCSVFKDDQFVGCFIEGKFCVKDGDFVTISYDQPSPEVLLDSKCVKVQKKK